MTEKSFANVSNWLKTLFEHCYLTYLIICKCQKQRTIKKGIENIFHDTSMQIINETKFIYFDKFVTNKASFLYIFSVEWNASNHQNIDFLIYFSECGVFGENTVMLRLHIQQNSWNFFVMASTSFHLHVNFNSNGFRTSALCFTNAW